MFRLVLLGSVALVSTALRAADEKAPALRLTKADLGKVPAGWKAAQTGKGVASVWKVEADATAPSKSGFVLTQTAKGPRATFNLCVSDSGTHQDVEVRVGFKALRGKDDQGGGIVWRYQDANNYYVARFNPLEDNFRLYKVVAGKRKQIESAEPLAAKAGSWHTLAIKHQGDRIECYLNGKKHIDAKDDAIKAAGKVGLWTKADAVTSFDQFVVRGLGK